ncbi:MAG: EamA family transporter [Bacteroidetes bacterium 4484_249]|nr:MAG: EamA family transporter [Bacteroidetes bacterium 4484_249]
MTNQNKAYILTVFVVLLWSTIASAFKISLNYLNFLPLLLFASAFSCVVLFIILLFQRKLYQLRQLKTKDIFHSSVLGFLNPFLYYLVLLKAYSILRAQEAGTLNYIWPIILVLLSIPILKQRINLKSIIAIVISFFGIIVISTEGNIFSLQFREPLGVMLAISSSIFWSLYWIFNLKDKRDEVLKLFLNFVFGTIYIFITVLFFSDFNSISIEGLAGALYIGLFEMGITFFLWLKALKLSENTAKISNLIYISPFISLVFIHAVVGEKILTATIIGLMFIISGIVLQQFSRKGLN